MKRGLMFFSVLGYMAMAGGPLGAQATISSGGSTKVILSTGQKQAIETRAEPGTVVLFQLILKSGLVSVQSTEAPRRLLDLGAGGQLLYAVTSSAEGLARIELSSAEQSRQAALIVEDATSTHSPQDRQHLLAAGIAFARADTTRRRIPGSPDASTALNLYDAAATEAQNAHDISLARWAMTQKARFLIYQRSSFMDSRVLLKAAIALPDEGDDAVQALAYKTLGADEYFLGNISAAIVAAENALGLYRGTGDIYWQGIVLGNLISQYGEVGRDRDAVAAGQEALTDAEQVEDPAGVVFTLTELGTVYREEGRYEEAFQTYRRAIAWGESIHYAPLIEAEIEKDLGRFYLDLGLWTEAEEQLHFCLSHASPDSQAALDAQGMLARVLEQSGKMQSALRSYDSALTIARKLNLKPEEATLLLQRSSALLSAGITEEAQRDIAQAAQLTDELKIPALTLEQILADGTAKERICPACVGTMLTYQHALSLSQEIGAREQEATANAGLARSERAQHANEAALESIEAALAIVERSRSSLGAKDLAASYFTGRHEWYDLAVELSMQLDRRSPGKGFDELAFRYAERARARTMLDELDKASLPQDASLPAGLRQRILANGIQLQKQKSLLLASTDPKGPAAALRSLYLEQDSLSAEARNQPGQQAQLRDDRTASPADIQQSLLRSGEALLAFSQGPSHTYRWLITRTSVAVSRLPARKELQQRFGPLQQMLLNRRPPPRPGEDAEQYQSQLLQRDQHRDEYLLEAGRILIPDLPPGIHHLYIVADGSLLSMPWNALRTNCGARLCYAVERYAISLEPSASVAVSLARSLHRSSSQDVLIVSDTIATRERAMPRWNSFTPLPGTRREAASIARLVPIARLQQLRGEKATVENVGLALRSDLAILHLSTHTLLVAGHPELSGIALSSGSVRDGEAQSVLWLRDIPSLPVPPLVTLSGCATQGQNLSGEELVALTQAFFYGGAEQVIGSMWSVDDEATATLMADFYRYLLKDRLSVADAMRQAQLVMLRNHAPLPDWAGFIVNGAASSLVPSRTVGN